MPYRAYGTSERIYVHGHVLDDRVLYESYTSDKRKKNIKAMLSRYLSEGIPDIRVAIRFAGIERVVNTDQNGMYEAVIELPEKHEKGWYKISYQVLDQIIENQEPLEEEGEVCIEDGDSQYIVVSDVDDTILISHATQTLRKLRLILTKNAKTRLPFTGVAAFYKALQKGNPPGRENPFFYVSSSEWNLYDFLEEFCDVRRIPKGTFMLQEMKNNLWDLISSGGGTHNHKRDKILRLLAIFSKQKFILIGDSGQRDARLYHEIATKYPNRILTIYIRDVGREKRAKKVAKIANKRSDDIDMVLVQDSLEAADHAHKKGYITHQQLEQVKKEFDEQQKRPATLVGQVIESQQVDRAS